MFEKIKKIDWFTGLGNYVLGLIMGVGFMFFIILGNDNCDNAIVEIDALDARVDSVFDDYLYLMDVHKDLSAEYSRLKNSCVSTRVDEAYSETVDTIPYYPPVDIQEPLPYIYEPRTN